MARKLERSIAESYLEAMIKEGSAVRSELSLVAITADADKLQSRVETDPAHAQSLSEAIQLGLERGDPLLMCMKPVIVFYDEEHDRYWLADGFHRYMAHEKLGLNSIWAWVIKGSLKDARLYSASANLENSKRTSKEDRKKAARMLFSEPDCWIWSDKEIARRVGLSDGTIRRLRIEFAESNNVQVPPIRISPNAKCNSKVQKVGNRERESRVSLDVARHKLVQFVLLYRNIPELADVIGAIDRYLDSDDNKSQSA